MEKGKTGNVAINLRPLTPLEDRTIALAGMDAVNGLPVIESCCIPNLSTASQLENENADGHIVVNIFFISYVYM